MESPSQVLTSNPEQVTKDSTLRAAWTKVSEPGQANEGIMPDVTQVQTGPVAKTETESASQVLAADLKQVTQVRPEQITKDSTPRAASMKASEPGQTTEGTESSSDGSPIEAARQDSSLAGQSPDVAQVQTAPTAKTETKNASEVLTANPEQASLEEIAKDSTFQQDSQWAPQTKSTSEAASQLKQPVKAVDAAAVPAKPFALETSVSPAIVPADISQLQPEVSGQRVQQAKAQGGATNSAASSGDASPASAAAIVSEAPSVKSSVVASGSAVKQAAGSVSPSAGGVAAGAFHSVAAQILANADAAPAASPSDQAVPAASQGVDASLAGQIALAVASVGPGGLGHQMVIQLTPPELGRVRLTLESRGDQIRGVLRVDDPATLSQLRAESPALLHRLSESGLDVRQMDIVPSHQGSGQSQPFGQGQDGQTARQQQSSPWRSVSTAPALQTTFNQATPADDAQYVGTGSINTLV
jgi:flagellar hook-length control protein FliK